jgi:hypothetical protein
LVSQRPIHQFFLCENNKKHNLGPAIFYSGFEQAPIHQHHIDLAFPAQLQALDFRKLNRPPNKYMNSPYLNPGLYAAPQRPQPKQRANEIFNSTIGQYEMLRARLEDGKTINLVCHIAGQAFDVFHVSSQDHFFEIRARDEFGNVHLITTPVEQIAFDIIISKKVNDEPPRDIIGFKVEQPEQHK